jgi:hypothetical protein
MADEKLNPNDQPTEVPARLEEQDRPADQAGSKQPAQYEQDSDKSAEAEMMRRLRELGYVE